MPEEGATLVGASAEDEGLTAAEVREGVAAQRAAKPPRRRRQPEPVVASSDASRRWPRRLLKGVALLLVLGAIGVGAVLGARQIWFLGADDDGRITLYRGLPYDLPFGIELYSEVSSIPITLEALPEDRRAVVTEHELRSRDDAESLADDLEAAAREAAAAEQPAGGGTTHRRGRRRAERRRSTAGGGAAGGAAEATR